MRYDFDLSRQGSDPQARECRAQGHTWPRYPGLLTRLRSRVFKRPETCRRCGTRRWA